MNILLFGKNGQVGWEMQRSLSSLGQLTMLDFPEINLAQPDMVRQAIRQTRPDVIVNAAAYTAVDKAESEYDTAYAINATAPALMAEEAEKIGSILIHISTDYVFDGKLGRPYCETDTPNPLSAYGRTKLAGDQAIEQSGCTYLIFRTSWVYSTRQGGFVTKVLEWARQQPVLRVVSDQVANPTWCRMLAEVTAQVLAMGGPEPFSWLARHRGLYHLAGSGYTSRLEWAHAILKNDPHPEEQVTKELIPALTADFPTPAERPLFSALDCNRFTDTFGLRLPDWQMALQMAMDKK